MVVGAQRLKQSKLRMSQQEFDKTDADGDGKISSAEWIAKNGSIDGFEQYDVSHDGSISKAEFKAGREGELHGTLHRVEDKNCFMAYWHQLQSSVSLYSYMVQAPCTCRITDQLNLRTCCITLASHLLYHTHLLHHMHLLYHTHLLHHFSLTAAASLWRRTCCITTARLVML